MPIGICGCACYLRGWDRDGVAGIRVSIMFGEVKTQFKGRICITIIHKFYWSLFTRFMGGNTCWRVQCV